MVNTGNWMDSAQNRQADVKTQNRSLEAKLPTIWTDEKQSREEAERRGRLEERRCRCAKR